MGELREYCTYCNTLHRAIHNENYCSNRGDAINDVSSNAYYFKSNNLVSGAHISRLSIRTISDGYQYHRVQNKYYMLDKFKYLMIPEGAEFSSEITTNGQVEGVLVAFNKKETDEVARCISTSDEKLLDAPFYIGIDSFPLETQSMEISIYMASLIQLIKNGLKNRNSSRLYYDEIFHKLLCHALLNDRNIKQKVRLINYYKASTREEIYKRLKITREYIDCNVHEKLSLADLSKVATMSSFHFLRNFQNFYKMTPHQYITQKRIEKANFLLKDSQESLDSIVRKIGYQDKSSFIRLFKKRQGMTTSEYRTYHNM